MGSPVVVTLSVKPALLLLPSSTASKLSFRHFNKHLECKLSTQNLHKPPLLTCSSICPRSPLSFGARTKTHLFQSVRCSASNSTSSISDKLKHLSLDSLVKNLSQVNPIGFCKWVLIFSVASAAIKWVINVLFSPFFWMYFSWTWLFWPWYIAVGIAFYGIYGLAKHLKGEANVIDQLAIVTSAFTWLTLVPPAYFNGFLEGWPYVFFFVYHYFFFFNVSVRKRLYGDYYLPEHDPKWDISPPNWYRVLFCGGVMVGHWLAAFEGPQLHLIPGGWSNVGIWGLIMLTLFTQYDSTLYLAKYSEKVVVPTAVVQFGPYRWVRHPIYASTMLLFASYFAALRAPLSSLFIIAVCVIYYEQKAKLEEALMLENFGEDYKEYMKKEHDISAFGESLKEQVENIFPDNLEHSSPSSVSELHESMTSGRTKNTSWLCKFIRWWSHNIHNISLMVQEHVTSV